MKVEHDEKGSRFIVRVEDEEAELTYRVSVPNSSTAAHVRVRRGARTWRGRGAREGGVRLRARARTRVVPTCPFVRRWLGAPRKK